MGKYDDHDPTSIAQGFARRDAEFANFPVRCILCGGDHAPHPSICDPSGIDRNNMDARQWNRITAMVQREANKGVLDDMRAAGMLKE